MKRNRKTIPATRLVLTSAIAAAISTLLIPGLAMADCVVAGVSVQCNTTSTTDTASPVNSPLDRNYVGVSATPFLLGIDPAATVNGQGLAISNTGLGGVTVTNNGAIVVDAGNTPTAGGTAALSVSAAGGPIVYTGNGSIGNNGNGNAFDATQSGAGSIDINLGGNVTAATGQGIVVRDVATSTGMSLVTNNVTALTAGMNAIDARSNSLTGDVTVVANGNVQAGNAGVVAAIFAPTATGNVDVTTQGTIDARFGIDTANFGAGTTTVNAVGPITTSTGNGIYAQTAGGNVSVTAGSVSSTGNTAIVAQQNNVAGAGAINVSAGNVTGTTGISATNLGTGATTINANGTVTGTAVEGINVNGNNAVSVNVANTVTGATRGMTLVGGTGGTGNIAVSGNGGFVGGTGDAANILNNGAGNVTVNVAGASSSTGGEGFIVRDTVLGGDISVTTGAVTALTAGMDAIDVQTLSTTADIAILANGNLRAGNTGIAATITPAASNGTINVRSNGSISALTGVDARNLGTGSTSVTTVGPVTATTGNGIFAQSNGGAITVNAGNVSSVSNAAISAQQINAAGIGAVNITTGNVSGTTGILVNNLGTGATTINANGTTTGTAGPSINANGHAATVNVSASGTVNGFIDLTDNADTMNNNGLFNTSGTSLFGLGSDQFNNAATMTVFNGATIFSGLETLSNTGTINMIDGAANDSLNISGNYSGTNSTLRLDTVLGDDASLSDGLVIGGNTSGFTGITVNNVGGLGALTTGDGIMVVNVAGTSAANAFGLNNTLRAGAFNYYLYQNGIANPADGDWYLRSTARGITSSAMAIPEMGNKASLMMLGTLDERLGVRGTDMEDGGVWARIVGNSGSQTLQSDIGSYDGHNDSVAVQAGVDILTTDSGTRFGTYVSGVKSNTRMFDLSLNPLDESGRAHLEGYAVGGYATHFGDSYYWDAVIQYSMLNAEASGDGDRFETDSKNWLASFEFGRAFKFGNNNAIEPQMQVIAGRTSIDAANDGFTNYDYTDQDSLLARLGVRWSHAKDQGTVKGSFVPYMKANVWRNFGDDSVINIGPSLINTKRDDTWADVGVGFSVLTQNNWAVFLQYDYERGIGDTDLVNHTGTIGLRRNW